MCTLHLFKAEESDVRPDTRPPGPRFSFAHTGGPINTILVASSRNGGLARSPYQLAIEARDVGAEIGQSVGPAAWRSNRAAPVGVRS
jgi:hypothetical protein